MDERCFVDDEKTVVELVGHLDRERVAVLRVEPRHIDIVKQSVPRVLHHENRHALTLLRDERQNAIRKIRVDDDKLAPRLLFKVTICDLKLVSIFEATICDLKSASSSLVNWNMKRSGKRSKLRLTA